MGEACVAVCFYAAMLSLPRGFLGVFMMCLAAMSYLFNTHFRFQAMALFEWLAMITRQIIAVVSIRRTTC